MEILALFQNLVGRLSPFQYWVLCWLWAYPKCWDIFTYSHFGGSFYHEWMLNWIKWFYCICWDNHVVFWSFLSILRCITLILHMSNQPCNLGRNTTWAWCMILFTYCWIQFANALKIFFIYVFERYWYVGFFLFFFPPCDVFVWLGYGNFAGLIEWARIYSFYFSHLTECLEYWYNFFFLLEFTNECN